MSGLEQENLNGPDAWVSPSAGAMVRVSLAMRLTTLVAIVIPLASVIGAPFFVWGWGFAWADLALLLGMYFLTGLGITVGFHRLFVHRSFETYAWMKFIWAVLGSMAIQGRLFDWVANHRCHHHHSDTIKDPHTPHHHGAGFIGLIKGFCHAHFGWLFGSEGASVTHYVRDLRLRPSLRVANALFPLWAMLGLIIPAGLGGIISLSMGGLWSGLIWGGLVRVFVVHHVTWSVNSACHLWGKRPYKCADESRNNLLFGIIGLGEGWHNTHHAFPTSARHGLRWWEIDVSYWVIRLLSTLGFAWNLKLPSKEAQRRERRV